VNISTSAGEWSETDLHQQLGDFVVAVRAGVMKRNQVPETQGALTAACFSLKPLPAQFAFSK